MSKIIVRRQEYANNGTHANEIEAVVKENLIANTLSGATDIAPSVGLLKSVRDSSEAFLAETGYFNFVVLSGCSSITTEGGTGYYYKFGRFVMVSILIWGMQLVSPTSDIFALKLPFKNVSIRPMGMLGYHNFGASSVPLLLASSPSETGSVYLQKQTGTGDYVMKGTDLTGKYTWQGTLIYFTDGTRLID